MDDKTFAELEKLNIQIDILIDEERYKEVYDALILADNSCVHKCFPANSFGTHNDDNKWRQVLDREKSLPVIKANGTDLANSADHTIVAWSQLFYAKRLRARIQEKGTDCYLRRLDDIIVYLESNPPSKIRQKRHRIKLSIFYLFELSAASLGFEVLGFARRARRVLKQERKTRGIGTAFSWYYELLSSYNIGLAYFHESRYRNAVMEFNKIIKEAKTKQPSYKKFFSDRNGELFLLLPAIIYRADIQIKLQLAYHSLDTLRKYFLPYWAKSTLHKKVRFELILADASQQMNDMKKSWKHLGLAFGYLSNLEKLSEKLGSRRDFIKLPDRFRNQPYPNVKGRFVDILVEDYVNWLKITYEDKKIDALSLSCVNKLQNIFIDIYFKTVKHNAFSRNGYYQQLAEILQWLTKKHKVGGAKLSQSTEGKFEPKFLKVMKRLYQANRDGLMQSEKDTKNRQCPHCDGQGINLALLDPEHKTWFTGAMLGFYKNMENRSKKSWSGQAKQATKQILTSDKGNFVKRLLEFERADGEDLRINDLELRYELDSVIGELPGGSKGKDLCRKGSLQEDSSEVPGFDEAFVNLLACVPVPIVPQAGDEGINSEEYEQIMKRWHDDFTQRLGYPSIHRRNRNGLYFISLQRWNSSSPAQGRSIGGGYLLYKTDNRGAVDLGIAIDPGFDFLRNLFQMGFTLDDIDIILISHAHADHIRDFESIAIMLHELKKRGGKEKKVHAILTLGAYKRLEHIIEDPTYRFCVEPYIIDVHKEIDPGYFEGLKGYQFNFAKVAQDNSSSMGPSRYRPITSHDGANGYPPKLTISPTRAYHKDSSIYSDSFGFKIEVKLNGGDHVTLGYTGDTKWVYSKIRDPLGNKKRIIEEIETQYRECDTLVVHLGSLIERSKSFDTYRQCTKGNEAKECEVLVRTENHPYLVGLLRLLSRLYMNIQNGMDKQLVLIGEFGEELRGGIRTDLLRRLETAYSERLAFLPLDVGMDIQLWPKMDLKQQNIKGNKRLTTQRVRCVQCEEFVGVEEAEFERYGVDEALYCVCRTCQKATPMNVLQDKLRHVYEAGYELEVRDNDDDRNNRTRV